MSVLSDCGVDGVYVIHAKAGYELHEQRINRLFKQHGIDFEFVTDGDPSLFTQPLLDKYFAPGIKLSKGVLSCTLNHFLTYERIAERKNRYALVFENDPFLADNFTKKVARIVREVEERKLEGFIISLENTCLKFPSFWATKRGQYLYAASEARAAGAYLVDLKGAERMLNDLKTKKCNMVIDWWHTNLIRRGIIKIYWAQPTLTEQGSHNGLLSSTISTQKRSLLRRFQWLSQKYYKLSIRRLFRQKAAQAAVVNPNAE